jgi:hypothetical protein
MGKALPQVERENGAFEVTIDSGGDFSPSRDEIGRSLGYPDNRVDPHFGAIIEQVMSRLHDMCDIGAGYRVLDVHTEEGRHDGLYVGNRFFTTGRIIASQLKKAEKAALFACTIGPGMESWSRQAFRDGDPVLGHIIDTVASLAVEKATGMLHDHIGWTMEQSGLRITNRFSPGYCGWPVTQQQLLFSFFPAGFCGIGLTDSALMIPMKSISGIIGIGTKVNRDNYFCDRCARKDCTYRAYRIAQARA